MFRGFVPFYARNSRQDALELTHYREMLLQMTTEI